MASPLSQAFDRIGGGPRVLAILVGLGALAAVWGFAQWGMAPAWVPVVSGVPMERIGAATQRLDEEGIAYKLERGGSVVSVEENQAARARVALAASGIGASAARPGFELFDQPSWGMTDFTQKVNYRRALEGELERTLGRMKGVGSAQVHLTVQESSFLKADERPSEASVVLELQAVGASEESVVEGIQFLVASSVEGMAPENVMVLDDRGRLLSSPDGDGGIGLSNRQLQVQRQMEGYLQNKAEALVAQMVGAGGATVRVAATLNFDQIEQTVSAVNPDQQALISEEKSETVPGTPEQGASQSTSNTVYETAHSVETTTRGGARLERLTVAVVLGDKRTEAADGSASFETRTPAEIARVEAVVKNAVGFTPERGRRDLRGERSGRAGGDAAGRAGRSGRWPAAVPAGPAAPDRGPVRALRGALPCAARPGLRQPHGLAPADPGGTRLRRARCAARHGPSGAHGRYGSRRPAGASAVGAQHPDRRRVHDGPRGQIVAEGLRSA